MARRERTINQPPLQSSTLPRNFGANGVANRGAVESPNESSQLSSWFPGNRALLRPRFPCCPSPTDPASRGPGSGPGPGRRDGGELPQDLPPGHQHPARLRRGSPDETAASPGGSGSRQLQVTGFSSVSRPRSSARPGWPRTSTRGSGPASRKPSPGPKYGVLLYDVGLTLPASHFLSSLVDCGSEAVR